MMRKLLKRLAVALLALVAVGIASIPFVAPALAAYACPGCYDLERAGERVYVEAGQDSAALFKNIEAARANVSRAFGVSQVPKVTLLVCGTEACDRRLGGLGARATAYGAAFIRISPRGWDETILTHEFAHIVLHDAVGTMGMFRGDLTAWRNEGLAVLASRDVRYFDFDTPACLHEPTSNLPATPGAWGKAMKPTTHMTLYAQAACAVFRKDGLPPYDLATLQSSLGAD